jgi:hypothetical protein
LTTTGHISGRPHTIEIWFALNGQTLYMLSEGGDRANWAKNALRQPAVTVKIKDHAFTGQARLAHDAQEDVLSRQLIASKYEPHLSNDLSGWYRSSLPVAIDLTVCEE